MGHWTCAWLLLVCLGGTIPLQLGHADTVVLNNGRKLEGRVEVHEDFVVVHLSYGAVRIPKSQIKEIVPNETPLDVFHARSQALTRAGQADNPDREALASEWSELAAWATRQNLPRPAETAYRQVLQYNAEDAAAREALGFVRWNDQWLTKAEKYKALGLVFHQGEWVDPVALADAKREEAAAEVQRQEAAKQETERRLKEAQAKKAELEARLLEERLKNPEPIVQEQPPPRYVPPVYVNPWPVGYPFIVRARPQICSPDATEPPTQPAPQPETGVRVNPPIMSGLHLPGHGPGMPVAP
jgi:hypothetical protein